MKTSHNQRGFTHIAIIVLVLTFGIIGIVGWSVYSRQNKETSNSTNTKTVQATPVGTPSPQPTIQKEPDSVSTFDSPEKIDTKDGQHFYYGAPAAHNNASPKKILITLHGTGGSAQRDYEVWQPFVKDTGYALASLNWWDGSGDQTTDYSTPEAMNAQIHDFLTAHDYTAKDLVVFEGFSRGSANSYPIVAHDRSSTTPMIDVAVSSSGGATDNYFALTTKSLPADKLSKIFTGVNWILACGDKDENPTRDGCQAMQNSKAFVTAKGATVLGVLSDPNAGHGALTTSSLNLTQQMFELIAAKYQ